MPELAGALEAAIGVVAHWASNRSMSSKAGAHIQKSRRRSPRAGVKDRGRDRFKHRMPALRARPERLAFIDETAVETNPARLRGRALRGQRLETNAPFGAWGTQTFIAGSTHNGPIAPWAIEGAMDGNAFAALLRGA